MLLFPVPHTGESHKCWRDSPFRNPKKKSYGPEPCKICRRRKAHAHGTPENAVRELSQNLTHVLPSTVDSHRCTDKLGKRKPAH